jgi:hypothetical protein
MVIEYEKNTLFHIAAGPILFFALPALADEAAG